MSGLKTLFEKQKESTLPSKTVSVKTAQDIYTDAESPAYISQYQDNINLYLQDVDFATASNFARFGSARKYYENITTRITNYFPYDKSKAEQLEFENNLNPFEKYIYLYQYPRTTGYVNFSPNGWGSQVASSGFYGLSNNPEYILFSNINDNNIYDPDNSLRENTRFIFSSGSTVEFWMKKDDFVPLAKTAREIIYYSKSTDATKRFFVFTTNGSTNNVYYAYYTRISGVTTSQFLFNFDTGASIADSKWHHYAATFYSSGSTYYADFYLDGVYKSTVSDSSAGSIIDFTGSALCTIGALGGPATLDANLLGYSKFSGSIDEFRFWNEKRNAKQIGLNYFVNVGGGNNIANTTNLGIYYKFNEGIVGNSSTDSTILDYAGRSCNGLFVGYNSNSRNTGSAITTTQEKAEVGTPILYYDHPDVQSFLTYWLYYADEHDYQNNFAIRNSLPQWIMDDDNNSENVLSNFLQTMASYLDTLYLQISTYKSLKNKDYLNYKGKPPPFSNILLTSNGFDLPSLFLNTDIVQSLLNQDNKRTYDEKINVLKNIIYRNIYNNLGIIYKSKGTENSIKQLIKTFGVDQDVFSLNIYANNTQYTLEDTYVNKSIKKNYVDLTPFDYNNNSKAVIYQSGSNSYITGTNNNSLAFTIETDLIIPKFPPSYDYLAYQTFTYNSASLFGLRTAADDNANISVLGNDEAALKAYLNYRDDKGYFSLSYPSASMTLTSSVFVDLLNNQHWNLSARLVPISTGSSFNLIFSGFSNFAGDQIRSFNVSASLTTAQGNNLLSKNKRLYVGAERDNITGSLQKPSLTKALSARYWADYLTDNELIEHAKNPNNFGRSNPADTYTLSTAYYIPKSETLLLHWDFTNITSSDSSGNSSTVYSIVSSSNYSGNVINNLLGKVYNGGGYGFESNVTIGGREFVYSSEQQQPENLYSSQLVDLADTDDNYTNFIRPQKYFFSLENSMYDVISKNMLNMFASIIEFNNFVGEPLNSYKTQYNKLKFFRKIFFNKIGNSPDLDRYVGVYKWIDDALDSILFNLLPASANASETVRTIVENHILERNKITYALTPSKNTVAVGGDQKSAPKDEKKYTIYFVDHVFVPYKTTPGFIPPVGDYASSFMDYSTSTGLNSDDQTIPAQQIPISAAKMSKRT